MYKGKKIFGLIPARGGSKGIPRKNLYPLQGKPLIQHTIEASLKSSFLDAIYCSTNDTEIADECRQHNCNVIERPEQFALDTSPTIEAVMHAVQTLQSRGENYDYMILLQPTSPLRTNADIDGIIKHVIDNNLPSGVSIHKIPFNPILIRYMNENWSLSKCTTTNSTVRRQDMNDTYYVNGALYMVKTADLSLQTSFNDIPNGYEIDPNHAVDINILSDIMDCQEFLKNLHE